MSTNWNTPVDAQSYFRQQEKRLQRAERRTGPSIEDVLGPGMAAQAVQIIDWNSIDATFNGFYYTQPGAVQNAPDSTLSWTGHVIAKDDGTGMQQVWNTDGPDTLYWIRTYSPVGDGTVTFTDWKKFASSSGFVDDTVLHPQVVSDIQQALNDSADAFNYAQAANSTFRQPTAPTSSSQYELRVNDTWFDTDDNNHIYVWDGTQWVDASDLRVAQALQDAADAQAAAQQATNDAADAMDFAQSKNTTYRQTTKPTGGTYSLGDVWFDTDDGNHIYVYDGADFVDARDANIAAAQAAAAQAQTDAQNAATTAANAQTTANNAASTASSAQTAANTAQTAANNASTLAQSKNTVYRQTAMPTGGTYRLGDTWFDTDDGNRVYVYDGSTFVDARDTTIATAQAAATAAQTAATNAQTAANNAQTTANNAQTSANGKNTITWSAAAPTTQANTAGDTWFVTSGGLITQQWQGTGGTSWSQKTLDNAVIANLDAGKLTAGTVAAARIGAGTIDVTKLNVTIGGGNLLADSSFESTSATSAWTSGSRSTAQKRSGGQSLSMTRAGGGLALVTGGGPNMISLNAGEKVTLSAWFYLTNGVTPRINLYSNAGPVDLPAAQVDPALLNQWQRVVATYTIPTSGVYYPRVYADGGIDGTWSVDEFQLERGDVVTAYSPKTDEILPGTIVTSMLQATAIDGMTVTGALLQTVATASRGVKMTSSGLTAYNGAGVQTLNIDGTTGTVTIVGSLNAGSSVNGAVVTGGTIQTEATAARGIKLSSTGLNAYNASGVATLTVSAMDGAVSMLGALQSGSTVTGATVTGGTIQTSANATTGIKIGTTGLTAYNASNTAVTTIDATTGVITTTGGVMTGGSVTGATLQTTATAARGIKIDSTQLIAYSDGTVSGGPAAGQATLQINGTTGAVTTTGAIFSSGSISGSTVTGGTLQSEPTANRGVKINSAGMTFYDTGNNPVFTLTSSSGAISMTGPILTGGSVTGSTLQTTGTANRGVKMTSTGLYSYDSVAGSPTLGQTTFALDAATGQVTMTGNLVAGSGINGATVTGGTVQTESTANTGIKMNSSGFTAYDANHNPTFTITASTGAVSMLGTLTSGSTISGATVTGGTVQTGDGSVATEPRIVLRKSGTVGIMEAYSGISGETPGKFYAQSNVGLPWWQWITGTTPTYPNTAYITMKSGDTPGNSAVNINGGQLSLTSSGSGYITLNANGGPIILTGTVQTGSGGSVLFGSGINTQGNNLFLTGGTLNVGGGPITGLTAITGTNPNVQVNSGFSMNSNPISGVAGLTVSSLGINVTGGYTLGGGGSINGQITAGSLTGTGQRYVVVGASGVLAAGASTSSLRYKENVQPLTVDPLKVLALEPIEFDWIKEQGGGRGIGFPAEQAHALGLHHWVGYKKIKGRKKPDGIDYPMFVVAQQIAMRHQQTRIEALEAKVEALMDRLN